MGRIEAKIADITHLSVDAIVNAANASLMGGGGVDRAIHKAGGPAILAACHTIRRDIWPEGLPTGQAVITTGGALPAKYVIHTVGPIYDRDPDPEHNLASCYRNCLMLAREHLLETMAFPAISTGVYGFPPPAAADIAVAETRAFLAGDPGSVRHVILTAFSETAVNLLNNALNTHPV